MQIETQLPLCRLRPWRLVDKPDLMRNANNRKVWRNLTDMFPHPYGATEADQWLQIACVTKDGCLIDSVMYAYLIPV